MRCKADLHMHSVLSPCGDYSMSPSLLFEKAVQSGFQMVSITEHNSLANARAYDSIAKKFGIHFIYGVEIQTNLEVHLLAYLPDKDAAEAFDKELYQSLPDIQNKKNFFGDQVLINEDEMVLGFENRLLLNSVSWDLRTTAIKVKNYGGLLVASHIDADSFSISSQLGFLPEDIQFEALEVVGDTTPWVKYDLPLVKNSDAHYLKDFGKRYTEYQMDEIGFEGLKNALQKKQIAIKSSE